MTETASAFLVARNPDPESKLPFLLRLPLGEGIVLKARDSWPATARVYCHRLDEGWPAGAEVVEETPVVLCRRRGAAVDLVLDRPRLFRSQFVFTRIRGREAIFWQTQKTARTANPGARIPRRRPLEEPLEVVVDTRERYPYRFSAQGAAVVRTALSAGDYAILSAAGEPIASVERKSLENLASTLSDGSLAFQLQPLADLPLAAIVSRRALVGAVSGSSMRAGNGSPTSLTRLQVRLIRRCRSCSPTECASRRTDLPVPRHRVP
jgi:hypothetical protein